MINTIGFLPNFSEIKELKPFVPDGNVMKQLEYLDIPVVQPEPHDTEHSVQEEKQAIKSTDNVLFCTVNGEEMSSVAIYGYDDVEMFFHHDFFVFSTILDSCHITDTQIAVATFEPAIMVYDTLVEFPVLPQSLLVGHSGPVTGIKNKCGKIMSCSDDKTIIDWDTNEMRIRAQTNYDFAIERFDFEGSALVMAAGTYLNINNENISLDYKVEQLRLSNNIVYISDENGRLIMYDVRMPAKAIAEQKVHEKAVVDVCLVNDWIITTSLDTNLKMWKVEGAELKCKSTTAFEEGSSVISIGFNPFNSFDEIFVGDEKDNLFPIKLECDAAVGNVEQIAE